MKIRLLIKLLMTVVIGSGAATVFAQGFEQVLDMGSYEFYDGVGFMKPGQCIVYSREDVEIKIEDENYEEGYRVDYKYNIKFYDKDFKEIASLKGYEMHDFLSFDDMLDNNNLINEVSHYGATFTQAFFNDDDDIEYAVLTEWTNEIIKYEIRQVISGKTIGTFEVGLPSDAPAGARAGFYERAMLDMAGNHYLVIHVYCDIEVDMGGWTDYETVSACDRVYRVNTSDSGAGMFKLVSETKTKTKAYPNPVNRGETLNLQLKGCEDGVVSFFDISGKYIKTVEISNGAASIATDDMQQGMYIYNVQSKGKTIGKNKLIVK